MTPMMKQIPEAKPAPIASVSPDQTKNATPWRDKELRARVKLFGNLLGQVIQAQSREKVFAAVEALRKGYINLRKKENPDKRIQLLRLISKLDVETLTQVVRAFSIYFSLANIAEEAYQHRQRQRRIDAGGPLWRGSFEETLQEVRNGGVGPGQLQILLDSLAYIPVITAHPTEAKRRTVMEHLRKIFLTSKLLDEARLSQREEEALHRQLERQIQVLWKTDEVRAHRPQVRDEIINGLFYFKVSLFQAVPETYRQLEEAIHKVYGDDLPENTTIRVPSFLHFGSWIGGDRDGNPNVKPEITAMAVRLQMRMALRHYLERIGELMRILTHSIPLIQPSTALMDSINQDLNDCPEALLGNPTRFSHEPYRRKLYLMRYRLLDNLRAVELHLKPESGLSPPSGVGYPSEDEFLQDLYLIRDSLINHGDGNIAAGELQDLIRLVESFGFYLLKLDIRQESSCHTEAVAELVKQAGLHPAYLDLSETERQQLLSEQLAREEGVPIDREQLTPPTRETLEIFDVMAQMRREVSPRVFGTYVISMTHAASHVLEVMFLGHLAGLAKHQQGQWHCDLQISPLFETIEDLEHIEPVMTALLDDPSYQALLQASGNQQEVMIGYSDSCKDGGILASSWKLYEAQKKVTALTGDRGVDCRIFHGRGGTIGRGGGPTFDAILSQPRGTVHGQIKFTEQGEVLSSRYSNTETAIYELDMGISGLIKASACLVQPPQEEKRDYLGVMDFLAEAGERAYRELTEETPGFQDYFYEATPVNEIGLLNIGSRPSHRKKGDRSKASVRAIAWVFGWAQARHTFPAWYGIGSALEQWRAGAPDRLAKLQAMYQEWPYFRAMLSNIQMSLAKAELRIAQQYAELCLDPETGERIFAMLSAEYQRTVTQVLHIVGAHTLLEENPSLALSLRRRDPYLDPLNHIQLTLIQRTRDPLLTPVERQAWIDPLLRSINAIAAGMRNTG
ncbi:Phosphoenolpyruvate carboxylase [Nitrosococcus halophilus Nc 4]|uniref:Phosphoenolpyruvate carboxylase n=1 Tax=Nitrosococcus halophilus (strain Nc4) TaxID=472759 RepID=D5C581_NITHN|nr:phosphoenolpyruvate carboxylase [Nitrosococcus halophilus]ADE15304.1 Phosphoenolpyruvate carboxylase [Nitrosococcus halophilus Nc 4]